MKTFDEILKSHYLHPLSKLEKEWIYSAMREACEQAIDECAKVAKLKRPAFPVAEIDKQSILNVKKLLK